VGYPLLDAIRNPWSRGLDRSQRRRILRAVRAGVAVDHPEDASYAVKAAVQVQRLTARRGSLGLLVEILFLGWFTFLTIAGLLTHEWLRTLPALLLLLAAAFYNLLYRPRLRERAARAERLNQEIIHGFNMP
jgi:hypothetical protein